ncbi:MAG TPA: DUF3017 domain-containing protein [Streptosporangiaceae bacterium]|nr:DUF3017 domain-containing protein [Streptosporangiaceae bacterium]
MTNRQSDEERSSAVTNGASRLPPAARGGAGAPDAPTLPGGPAGSLPPIDEWGPPPPPTARLSGQADPAGPYLTGPDAARQGPGSPAGAAPVPAEDPRNAGAGTLPGRRPPPRGVPGPAAGAGQPRSRRGRLRLANLPYLVVLACVAGGLVWTWQDPAGTRGGTLAIAGALFVAALARLVLPEERAGMLASRKRYMDVVTLAVLAVGLLAAGLVLPPPS